MSGTLASLIRQHALNPKLLYHVPETDRESAPGRYDQTGSQKSPAIDRQVEKETAKTKGEKLGFDPEDLDGVDGLDDLQDLLDDKLTDPTGGDPGETPTDPLDPTLPDPDDPYADDPDVEAPTPIEGVRAFLLHGQTISYTHDGGASFKVYDSPNNPIGFAVTSVGIYVAQFDAVHYSPNLVDGWTELSVPSGILRPISGFANGSFEAGITGWDLLSGIEPRATNFSDVPPTHGENYLTRDRLFFTNSGAFEVAQTVELTPTELAAIGQSYLSFSADIACDSGSVELRLERNVDGMPYFGPADRIYLEDANSDLLSMIAMTATNLPDHVLEARISFEHRILYQGGGLYNTNFYFRVWLLIVEGVSNVWRGWGHDTVFQYDVPVAQANIYDGRFRKDFTLTLASLNGYPGTIELRVPNGWKFPIESYIAGAGNNSLSFGYSYTSGSSIGFGSGWIPIATVANSDFGWNRISVDVYSLASSEIRCVIKGNGSPADVYVDNARLDLVEQPIGVTVTAISKGADGSAYAAVNGALHRLHPTGMTRIDNGWTINPTGLNGNSIGWEGSTIATDAGEISAPGPVKRAFADAGGMIVVTEDGGVYQRVDDSWNSPFGDPIDGQICYEPLRGIYMMISDQGSLVVSRDGQSWENGPTLPGGYHGEFEICTVGRRVFIYAEGRPMLWWLDSNSLRLGGSAPSGILDISGR